MTFEWNCFSMVSRPCHLSEKPYATRFVAYGFSLRSHSWPI